MTVPEHPTGDAVTRVPAGTGEPRGVRPYQPGDTRRSVHWPATSHVGSLMVRENERQTDDPIFVELVLPADLPAAEAECESGDGLDHRLVVRGRVVVLGTREPEGPVARVVRDRIDLGRRLARAVPSPVAASPRPPTSGEDDRTGRHR